MSSARSESLPVALTIAGSDSCGGAGIQADLKTFTVMGVYGASVVTAITAQNTIGVRSSRLLELGLIDEQITAVTEDMPVAAVKTGMLGSVEVIETVAAAIERHGMGPVVVDPVMIAKSGDALIDEAAVQTLAERLLPLGAVVTPNRHEAARLLSLSWPVSSVDVATDAAKGICEQFDVPACVVKGIRRETDGQVEAVDVLFDGQVHELTGPWHDTASTHGSGCAFAAAICAGLALGRSVRDAAGTAKLFISRAIERAPVLGGGTPPVNPLANL